MLKVFIAAALIVLTLNAQAKSEMECLKQLSIDTKHSDEQITKILMECNNRLLDGQFMYINAHKFSDALIRKRWPCKDDNGNVCPVTAIERAHLLLDFNECENIARNLKEYMKRCEGSK